jgi:hypothetical protein
MHNKKNVPSYPSVWTTPMISLIILLVTTIDYHAQNLVPNNSIENANCPTTYNGFPAGVGGMIPDWYSVTCTSPDAFTNCSNNTWTQVPNNLFGSQNARTGSNYLGFGMYSGWYDYVGAKLSCKMITGNSYQVSFWLSRCDNAQYAADEIGMYISAANTKMTCGFGNTVLSYVPQIKNPSGNYLTDSNGWTEVTGTYVATGGEEYITIGYFKPWNVTDFLNGGTGYSLPRSAYYLDDISIVGNGDCPLELVDSDHRPLPLSDPSSTLEVLYDPEENKIQIKGRENISTVSAWSMNGNRLELTGIGKGEFKLVEQSTGIYLLVVETDHQVFRTKLCLF